MKKFSIFLILAFCLTGCAGLQIDWGKTSEKGPKLVGCLVADNNPEWTERIIKYCDMLMRQGEPIDFQYRLEEGIDWLLEQYIDKPAIRLMIIELLPEIRFTGSVPTPDWMDKAKPIILNFREGVKLCGEQPIVATIISVPDSWILPTPTSEISFIERYLDVYENAYLYNFPSRGLP